MVGKIGSSPTCLFFAMREAMLSRGSRIKNMIGFLVIAARSGKWSPTW